LEDRDIVNLLITIISFTWQRHFIFYYICSWMFYPCAVSNLFFASLLP
jgi:hypothetical protein